ncbi:MAG TPA: hypothetical protein PLQ89_15860 [Phycisphaerae bacterium]|nr:hypothetical protein [Phycisphaerae bacterium]HON67641.1 hypothetical protein [Phycisphaerae bacterium]HOQ87189.1 hypothetical protein [Phycisphaerae bacterium]
MTDPDLPLTQTGPGETVTLTASPRGGVPVESASAELNRLNQELAGLLDRAPAVLAGGADNARRDPLVICGLLGGKDVGKSTLINALAGQEISVDREEVGAGTSRPLVYVHRDMIAPARDRLGAFSPLAVSPTPNGGSARPRADKATGSAELRFFPHQADSIRNVVLVDLPDFDSDFRQHEAIARAVAPFLDRVIWVVTPRKIADRAWVSFARDVVKASTNIYFVLNKSDELLSDEDGEAVEAYSPEQIDGRAGEFLRQQRSWAAQVLRQTGYEVEEDRLFLVAAQYPQAAAFVQRVATIWDDPHWKRYGSDRDVVSAIGQRLARELHRLRDTVLAPVDPETAARIKEENLRAQVRQNAIRVCEHYELDYWVRQAERVIEPEYRQVLVNSAFGADVCRTLALRLLRSRRSDVELADEVMDARANRWPVLRGVYWLSRWAIRRLGRAVSGAGAGEARPTDLTGGGLFRVRARSMADRTCLVVDRLQAEHGPLVRQLRLAERLPEAQDVAAQLESDLAELPQRGDRETVERLSHEYRPSAVGRLLVWAVLLWFPFVQPITAELLGMSTAGMDLTDWLNRLYRVVLALGATQLLHGFVVVGIIYVAMLAAIYARCVRDIQTARGQAVQGQTAGEKPRRGRRSVARAALDSHEEIDRLTQEIDAMLLEGVIGPILRPFEVVAGRLSDIRRQLLELAA